MTTLKNFRFWIDKEVCSASILAPALAFICAVALLTLTACSGTSSPTEPSPVPTPNPNVLTIVTAGNATVTTATVPVGTSYFFGASGGNPNNYSWSLPSGGGTLSSLTSNGTTFTAGSVPGNYTIQLRSDSAVATASIIVPTPTGTQNSVSFVSSDPAPGSTLKVGDKLNVTIGYTILQPSSFNVYPEGMSGQSTGETVMTPGSGTVKIVYTATKPGTSTVLDLNMGWGPAYAYSLTNKVAVTYTWVNP